jgi:hypothetical protein
MDLQEGARRLVLELEVSRGVCHEPSLLETSAQNRGISPAVQASALALSDVAAARRMQLFTDRGFELVHP